MSLYGDSNTVKGYAFVSLKDKTVVGTGLLDTAKSDAKALNNAIENYIDALKEKGIADNVDKSNIIVDESKINESNNADITDDNNAKDKDIYEKKINGKYYGFDKTWCYDLRVDRYH